MATVTKVKRKKLATVPPVAPAPEQPAKEKEGAELVEEGLQRLEEALERFALGIHCLNDAGKEFWTTTRTVEQLKQLQDFVSKSEFALSSLRDEVKLALTQPKGPKLELPKIEFPVPSIPVAAIFSDKATAQDIAGARDTVHMALGTLAQAEIPMVNAENGLRILTFMTELHKSLKVMAEAAKGVAA